MLKLENQEYKGLPCNLYYEVKEATSSKAHPLPDGAKASNLTVAYDVYTSETKEFTLDDYRDSHTFLIAQSDLMDAVDVYALAYTKLKELEKFTNSIDC